LQKANYSGKWNDSVKLSSSLRTRVSEDKSIESEFFIGDTLRIVTAAEKAAVKKEESDAALKAAEGL
jgi:hypothetical protein